MKVYELIERLHKVDPDADVKCYAGYDPVYGAQWEYLSKLEVDEVGWDDDLEIPIVEVFIE